MKSIFYLTFSLVLLSIINTYAQTSIPNAILDKSKENIYTAPETPAEYHGGTSELYGFIYKNFKYPSNAEKANIGGRQFVKFVVKKNGTIDDIQVIKGIGFGLDKELIRVLELMPKWKPAYQNDKPVNSYFTMPISICLE
ncbi:energy transducer TonB [uncultured Arcticibacterium sp.]|uniref:energy transducer TonB n=1 Tax=uncultured Arcticibacterium sp. TaxID=2173042 RepID=UPI0030F5FF41